MSGHSKWATIKRKKAKLDVQKGKAFTKVVREITVAAREGGGDPAGNARLRLLLDKAREVNMPQDNIMRAIKKGTGELEGASYEAMRYEGHGPAGSALIMEILTDNKNRTASDVRHVMTKLGGKLGGGGSVEWMFEKKGVVLFKRGKLTEDDILEKLLGGTIDDLEVFDEDVSVTCPPDELAATKQLCKDAGFAVESAEIEWVAKEPIEISSEDEEKVHNLLEALEELDDVQNVYANVK
jgi:YebC/PmpR family DNA-binding regulatory protein